MYYIIQVHKLIKAQTFTDNTDNRSERVHKNLSMSAHIIMNLNSMCLSKKCLIYSRRMSQPLITFKTNISKYNNGNNVPLSAGGVLWLFGKFIYIF